MSNKYRYDFEHYFHEVAEMKILADPYQYAYVEALIAPVDECQIIFVDAQAGSGKTSAALTASNYLLNKGKIDSVVYVRNAIALRDTGFLPGTLCEKEAPYMQPAREVFNRLGQDLYESLIEQEILTVTTTSYMRGTDMPGDKVVIIDEAQNLSLHELQTVLTRIHDTVKVVVIGSTKQNDNTKIKRYGPDKLLPFEMYMRHFQKNGAIPSRRIELVNNYRGNLSQYADNIQDTVEEMEQGL